MFEVFRNAWKIADLRKKIFYTVFILIIFRLGSAIPVPFLDASALSNMLGGDSNNFMGYLNLMTGGNFSRATLFTLSITPYINASIIMQLLTIAVPALERLSKAGDAGKKKIDKITRYLAAALSVVLGFGYYLFMQNTGATIYTTGFEGFFTGAIIKLCFAAGAMLVMWLGDQISEKGIGNGISMILFAGIISSLPGAVISMWSYIELAMQGATQNFFIIPLVVVLFALVIYFIVVMTTAERKIPVQYAKRVVGRKMYGGQSSHIPVKVSMSGVLPVIFAGAILSIPGTIAMFMDRTQGMGQFLDSFNATNPWYAAVYFLLIIAFNYFYVAVQYNPVEMANNLRKNSGAIPGIRPGKPTSDFIARIISKITFVGALFLGIVAVFPIIFTIFSGVNISVGGTSVIIVVGVALETSKALESQLMMRHYKGFLE